MSQLIPIVTTTLGARSEIAGKIIARLNTEEYKRIGGVIRRVDNKEVIAWLRTVSEDQRQYGPVLP
jgi:hypothetical protein